MISRFHGASGDFFSFELIRDFIVNDKFSIFEVFFKSFLLSAFLFEFVSFVKFKWFRNCDSVFTFTIVSRESWKALHIGLNIRISF